MDSSDLRRIVIGVDFHESSSRAATWTMRHFAPDADHALVHVVEIPELPKPLRGLGRATEQLRRAARAGAQHHLDQLAGSDPSARVTTHVLEGKPAPTLVRFATQEDADLIVVGEYGPRRGVEALLGSTAERVLLDSAVAVLVARSLGDAPRRLLAAVDDSEISTHVLAWTNALIRRFDGEATVLNVVDARLLADQLTGLPTAGDLRVLEQSAVDAMQDWVVETARERLPQDRFVAKVAQGDPSYEIITEAHNAGTDLVLIGRQGGSVAWTPLIGRIVNKVVRSAHCSVLVVTDGARLEDPRRSLAERSHGVGDAG